MVDTTLGTASRRSLERGRRHVPLVTSGHMAFVFTLPAGGHRQARAARCVVPSASSSSPPRASPFDGGEGGGKTSPFAEGGAARGAKSSDADAKKAAQEEATAKNRALAEWLEDGGVYMSDRSTWGKAPHGLVIANETTDEGEPCGRGLLAKRDLTQGEPIFEIPEELCMTRKKAVESLNLDEELNEYLALACYLISERNKGDDSFFKPYLDVLPRDEDLNSMFRWSDEDLAALEGSPSRAACRSLKDKLKAEFKMMDESLFTPRRKEFPEDIFCYEAWEWAFAVLFSRAILFDPLTIESQELALVPYADLLNHNPFCSAFIERQNRMFRKKARFVALYTDRTYTKMEQIYTTYGQKSNAELLILYGFVVDRNPYDSLDVTVALPTDDELYERKEAYLTSVGKSTAIDFPLYADRSPVEMIEFLRFCVANESELEVGIFNRMVSPRNELKVAEVLVQAAKSALDSYPTTLEEDNKLITDRKLFGLLNKNQRQAVKLRRSEKRILNRTINDIERRRAVPEKVFAP